jgi:hypothetical protein
MPYISDYILAPSAQWQSDDTTVTCCRTINNGTHIGQVFCLSGYKSTQGIYNYRHETNCVSTVYSVAAVLWLHFVTLTVLFPMFIF